MSDIAKNVIHFPSSLIHEDIAHWESKTPPKDEAAAHLLKMADHFARRLEKEPAARDEVVQSLDRVRKAHDIKRAGADILSTALENLRSSKPVANYTAISDRRL